MEKSIEVESITFMILEGLKELSVTPKMYHPTKDQINLGVVVDGKKVIIEIKTPTT